jgi:HEPN domain-containing protein
MKPNIEEAWRSLRLADRDITAFTILKQEPEAHASVVNFHAQQAVEKSLKAVLYAQEIVFERTHDLVKLAQLLADHDVTLPVSSDQLRLLNPFAVTFRYDDLEIDLILAEDADTLVTEVRRWAEEQVESAAQAAEGKDSENADQN